MLTKERSDNRWENAGKVCSSIGGTLAIQGIRRSSPIFQESSLLATGIVFSIIGTTLVVATTIRKLFSCN